MSSLKGRVRNFWDASPCGTGGVRRPEGSKEFFAEIERRRYELEPFIFGFAQFSRWKGKRVLEIGCGTGTDNLQFCRSGSNAYGIDLSRRSVALARKRLDWYGFDAGKVFVGDAEDLPFPSNSFDLVYSWGVLHHTPDTVKALAEIHRVLRPGGEICIMLYHRRSLVTLQFYIKFGLLSGRPFRGVDDIMAAHQESPGTKVYTRGQVKNLFAQFQNLHVRTIVTPYDLQTGRRRFLPAWMREYIPNSLGYFLVVQGSKLGGDGPKTALWSAPGVKRCMTINAPA